VYLSDAGQARVRGYLFMLERSLQAQMPKDAEREAVRGIESRIKARIVTGLAFLVIGLAKPIFPDNVGFWTADGVRGLPTNLGFMAIVLALTHWGAPSFLAWYRDRRVASSVPL
jgi:hypothetical protein